MAMSTFKYEPLADPSADIRLVIVHPATCDQDEIKCDLQSMHISEARYESVSYAWGDASITSPILLEGYQFEVTVNLANALRSLRRQSEDPNQTRTLWVDAICIDQSNNLERSEQVQRMSSIYKSADQVIVWLGNYHEPEDETCWGDPYQFEVSYWPFEQVEPANFESIQGAFKLAGALHDEFDHFTRQIKPGGVVESQNHQSWAYLSLLCRRKWFKRLWVVQEVFFASKANVVCGRAEIPWKSFEGAGQALVECVKVPSGCPLTMIPLASPMLSSNVTGVSLKRAIRTNIVSMLVCTSELEAKDPRDRLFAIRSLLGQDAVDIDVDYSKTAEEVYTDWARKRIKRLGHLDILSLCVDSGRTPYIGEEELPSWVPDLRNLGQIDQYLVEVSNGLIHREVQYAAAGLGGIIRVSPEHPDSSALSMAGLRVDKIHKIICSDSTTGNSSQNLRTVVINLEEQVSEHFGGPFERGTSPYVSFVDVLFRGCGWRDNFRATSQTRYHIWRTNDQIVEEFVPLIPEEERNRVFTERFELHMSVMISKRGLFFITQNGHIGMVSRQCNVEVDDEIWVLPGGNTPFILVPLEERYEYQLLAPCYVNKYMDGQAICALREGALEHQMVYLV